MNEVFLKAALEGILENWFLSARLCDAVLTVAEEVPDHEAKIQRAFASPERIAATNERIAPVRKLMQDCIDGRAEWEDLLPKVVEEMARRREYGLGATW